jgi:hypothetical protein
MWAKGGKESKICDFYDIEYQKGQNISDISKMTVLGDI